MYQDPSTGVACQNNTCSIKEQFIEEVFPCFIRILPSDEMEITDIELHQYSGCNTYLSVVASGGAVAPEEITSGPCEGEEAGYKKYIWKAYDINAPSEEIEGFFSTYVSTDRRCAGLDMEHDYFNQLTLGESVLFLVEVTVEDWMGNTDTYKKIVRIDPINITIGLEHTRCPGSEGYLSLDDFVVGGNGNLGFVWSGIDAGDIIQGGETQQNPLFEFPNIPGAVRKYTLEVTDAGGCPKYFNFSVTLSPTALDLPPSMDACIGSSAQVLGPGTEYIGGSGDYLVQWESSVPSNFGTSMLSDPTALNTIVTGQDNPSSVQYTLTVEDVYDINGVCRVSDNIWVDGVTFDNFDANAGLDRTKTSGDPVCYGEGITIGTPPIGNDYSYYWTSDHPDFEESTDAEPVLSEELNRQPGGYLYRLQVIHTPTGCFKEDDVNVEVC